jgi:hypothetical protein
MVRFSDYGSQSEQTGQQKESSQAVDGTGWRTGAVAQCVSRYEDVWPQSGVAFAQSVSAENRRQFGRILRHHSIGAEVAKSESVVGPLVARAEDAFGRRQIR